ncbi:unnamed protein product [Citrullus colocynthis]|uniref:Uncharacterized protein n=1 Tax=Citrullus colocynthis TaxID=252529 RepID=A0ABP0Y027_9ROSI
MDLHKYGKSMARLKKSGEKSKKKAEQHDGWRLTNEIQRTEREEKENDIGGLHSREEKEKLEKKRNLIVRVHRRRRRVRWPEMLKKPQGEAELQTTNRRRRRGRVRSPTDKWSENRGREQKKRRMTDRAEMKSWGRSRCRWCEEMVESLENNGHEGNIKGDHYRRRWHGWPAITCSRRRGGERTKGNIPVETWSEKGKEERGKEKRKLISGGHGRRRRVIWSETWKRLLKEAERKGAKVGRKNPTIMGPPWRDRR